MRRCLTCNASFVAEDWRCPSCQDEPSSVDGFLAFAPKLAHGSDGFEEAFFNGLFELESDHFWLRSRNRLIVWALGRFFPRARSFLELGCGTGFVLRGVHTARPDLALAGSEIFTRGLAFAHRRVPDVPFFQIDARRMPFVDEVDVVGAFDVIEHIDEDELVLRELYRSIRPGGGLIVTVPQHRWLWSAMDDFSLHRRRYGRREQIGKVRRAGFASAWCTSFVTLLVPALLASRLRQAKSLENLDPAAELAIGRLEGSHRSSGEADPDDKSESLRWKGRESNLSVSH